MHRQDFPYPVDLDGLNWHLFQKRNCAIAPERSTWA
jgi:hypothetical protein